MAMEADTQQERVVGRVWTVRLDPHGRLSAGTVRLSCSRPPCADQHLPSAAAGRKAAIEHVNLHLTRIRAGGGPRGGAWCACRAAECAWHTPDPGTGRRAGARSAAGAVRCGGPVVLTVHADRAGRAWRIAETCARCAAATPDCRVLDTAQPRAGKPAAEREPAGGAARAGTAGAGMAAVFSDHAPVPGARAASPGGASRRAKRSGKIAQRIVPHDLQPDALRVELIELGDAFRAYQRNPEPDLAHLAELHDRKARAFRQWGEVNGDDSLLREAVRAEEAAEKAREMHEDRVGGPVGDDGQVVERLLTRQQAVQVRAVLDYARDHAPCPEPGVRLAVLLLALRAARAGTGNVTGQDLGGWLQNDAEQVLERLVEADWLRLPGTVAEVMTSRPENPTAFTVPTLLPEMPRPFAFGKANRSRISGWAQKAVGDRKLRKKKAAPATRLLALYTAAHARPDGHLGPTEDGGLPLDQVAAFCALTPEEVIGQVELLLAADWLAEADMAGGTLRGRLSARVLPLGGLLSPAE